MTKLKIAVQKSGRLNEDSMKLLKDIGVSTGQTHHNLSIFNIY